MSKQLIQDGISITLSVMDRKYKDFNPNNDDCYPRYNHELCDLFSNSMLELTGRSAVVLSGESGYRICKYGNHYIDICGNNPAISIFKPKRFK